MRLPNRVIKASSCPSRGGSAWDGAPRESLARVRFASGTREKACLRVHVRMIAARGIGLRLPLMHDLVPCHDLQCVGGRQGTTAEQNAANAPAKRKEPKDDVAAAQPACHLVHRAIATDGHNERRRRRSGCEGEGDLGSVPRALGEEDLTVQAAFLQELL